MSKLRNVGEEEAQIADRSGSNLAIIRVLEMDDDAVVWQFPAVGCGLPSTLPESWSDEVRRE